MRRVKKRLFCIISIIVMILGATGTANAYTTYNNVQSKDFSFEFMKLSKQKVIIRISTKNPKITKYLVTFYENKNGRDYFVGDGRTVVIPDKRTSNNKIIGMNIITNNGLYSVGVSGSVDIQPYIDGEAKGIYNYSFKKLDDQPGVKIQNASEAKKYILNSVGSHEDRIETVAPKNLPSDFFWQSIRNDKWRLYNEAVIKNIETKEVNYFSYKEKDYIRTVNTIKYYLTKSQDSNLRKKYLSISKKAKGSAKSKAKYFVSYLTKNCSYKKTNLPTTYEFLLTKKKGQCYHYAKAFAILCNISGVKCEYVTGDSPRGYHAWNIVKIGKKWYWCDPCWADSGKKVNKKWMFKGYNSKDFKKRKLDKKYRTASWKKAHPLGKSLKY